ncbi:hypothetical protein TRAPUB_5675 [Trametes pubescens]|uniref:Uncharacterized protein n=1 Tax=Trametes pubescens TaxID=154538 RepID=A0A1M2V7X8_TRAPU|nr:hypothetical protein TRAPUB_5675 [Trametes pubescens]
MAELDGNMVWKKFEAGGGSRSRRANAGRVARLAVARGGAATSCLLPKYHKSAFLQVHLALTLGPHSDSRDLLSGASVLCLEVPLEVKLEQCRARTPSKSASYPISA